MIEFDGVSKSFATRGRRKVILDRADLHVGRGRSVGILAPNGAGKTTIVNMMAGLERPDEGEVRRRGRVSFPLGFMGGVVPRQSATENARFVARLYGLDPDYVEAYCRWACDLGAYFDMPVGTYSAGMRSRLSFALMLALDFDTYLIDEGMPGTQDAAFNRRAGRLLRERLERATVVMVSHQAETLARWCDAAAVLRHGKLHQFDRLEDAKTLYDYEA